MKGWEQQGRLRWLEPSFHSHPQVLQQFSVCWYSHGGLGLPGHPGIRGVMMTMAVTHGACCKIKPHLESRQLHLQTLQCGFLQVLNGTLTPISLL